jgi:alginate O-acetyltransferase complex protein AlgI
MIFSSPEFLVFFVCYFAIHLLTPPKQRIYLIIVGSTIFYAWWKIAYVWLPFLLVAIAYVGLLWIQSTDAGSAKRWRLGITIACLFLPLAFFKYSNFIYQDVLGPLLDWHGTILNLPLPLGISFVTFTLTAFVVDIACGQFKWQPNLRDTMGYVLFFPHLIAGPILRPADLLPQLAAPRASSIQPVAAIAIFTTGLVKKLVFADTIAPMVDATYSNPAPSSPAAVFAIYGFAVQIYCDFSGYTDMAIALAMLIGVQLPQNFARPYCAASAVEFWRRWHMTLSFWLRDYLYIPLGGNREGRLDEFRNIMVTMVLGGLWHGANWTFVLWGAVHGLAISASHIVRQYWGGVFEDRRVQWISVLLTFHFVALAWVLFRAPSFARAGEIFAALARGGWSETGSYVSNYLFPISLTAAFFLIHGLDDHRRILLAIRRIRREIVWVAIAFGWILAVTISQGSSAKFIYFDF